jgi:hypothetical protein
MATKFSTPELAAKFEAENGERHRTLQAMRQQGAAFVVGGILPEGFDALYEAEADWLEANRITYSPSKGWHEVGK